MDKKEKKEFHEAIKELPEKERVSAIAIAVANIFAEVDPSLGFLICINGEVGNYYFVNCCPRCASDALDIWLDEHGMEHIHSEDEINKQTEYIKSKQEEKLLKASSPSKKVN